MNSSEELQEPSILTSIRGDNLATVVLKVTRSTQVKNEQRVWTGISLEKIDKWPKSTWKDA